MVAYAYAAAHRDSTSRLVTIDAPLADESSFRSTSFPRSTGAGSGSLDTSGSLPSRTACPSGCSRDARIPGSRDSVDLAEEVQGGDVLVGHRRRRWYAASAVASPDITRAADVDSRRVSRCRRDRPDNFSTHRDRPLIIPVLAIGAEGTFGQIVHDQVVRLRHRRHWARRAHRTLASLRKTPLTSLRGCWPSSLTTTPRPESQRHGNRLTVSETYLCFTYVLFRLPKRLTKRANPATKRS